MFTAKSRQSFWRLKAWPSSAKMAPKTIPVEKAKSTKQTPTFRRTLRFPALATHQETMPRQGWHHHPKSLIPSTPNLLCEYASRRVFQYPPELFQWYVVLCYRQICRRAITMRCVRNVFKSPSVCSGRSYHTTLGARTTVAYATSAGFLNTPSNS